MSKRSDKDIVIALKRKEKGCKVLSKETKVTIDNYAFKSCLCHPNYLHPLFYFLIDVNNKYKEGVLPFGGSLMDQPAQIIELLNFIRRLEVEQEIEDRKEKSK